jgi:hypothetical protein
MVYEKQGNSEGIQTNQVKIKDEFALSEPSAVADG